MVDEGSELQRTGTSRGWLVPVAVGGLALVGGFVVLSALTSFLFSWLPLLVLAAAGWGVWRLVANRDASVPDTADSVAPPPSLPMPTGPPSNDVLRELEALKQRTGSRDRTER